jgi:hypothetical protein
LSRLRGYFQGRYRDHVYLTAQAEWRIHIAGRFSVAPFAAVGNVFPALSAVSFDRTKVAGGGAVRFSLKKERDLNVHIDVAESPIAGIYPSGRGLLNLLVGMGWPGTRRVGPRPESQSPACREDAAIVL